MGIVQSQISKILNSTVVKPTFGSCRHLSEWWKLLRHWESDQSQGAILPSGPGYKQLQRRRNGTSLKKVSGMVGQITGSKKNNNLSEKLCILDFI